MSFVHALIASLSLTLPSAAQADTDRVMTLSDLAGSTWNIAVPGQFPATLQFTDQGLSVIAACNAIEVTISAVAGAALAVTDNTEIYACGTPGETEADIMRILQSLERITSETPASLTLMAKDGATITATR